MVVKMDKVSIIIPVYKGRKRTINTLRSIIETTTYPYDMIIIADEVTKEHDYKYLVDFQRATNIDLMLIIRKKRLGVISANNLGIKLARKDVLLTQNDVIFPQLKGDCWLTRLVNITEQDNAGMVGCDNSVLDEYVGSWCCYIPRTTINKVGYFDERFGWAMDDDIDYMRRVKLHGLNIVKEESFEVKHEGSATLKEDVVLENALKKKAREIYNEKWKDYNKEMKPEKYDYWG